MSFVCEICDKSFVHKAHLKRHLLSHGGEKTHVCNICNKSFFRKENLKKHSLTHSGARSHVCHVCNRTFAWKQTLKEHLLVHTGESPYVCNVCNRSFSQKGHLKNHALIHVGEKPHVCNICNKAFTERGTMRRHLLTHSGEKSHVCIICDKSFSRKDFLRRHALLHSGKTPGKKVKKVAFSILREDRSNLCSFCKKVFNENVCSKLQFAGQRQKSTYACDNCLENFVETDELRGNSEVSCSTSDAANSTSANASLSGNCDLEYSNAKDETIYFIKEEHNIKCEDVEYLESHEVIDKKRSFDYIVPNCVLKEALPLDCKEINAYKTAGDGKNHNTDREKESSVAKKTNDVDRTGIDDFRQKCELDNEDCDGEFNITFVNIKEEPLLEREENTN